MIESKKIVIIDNYDSFTYNLQHLIQGVVNDEISIFKNDAFDLDEIERFDYIIISPGPGLPEEAGKMPELIKKYRNSKNILGVCLGLQAIGLSYGGRLRNLSTVYHGIESKMIQTETKDILFTGVPQSFKAGRYHSWVLDDLHLPKELLVTARDESGEIMAIRHFEHSVFGVQFHPESIMTPDGRTMVYNFLSLPEKSQNNPFIQASWK